MTVAFKWSSCLELFMETLSQLGGGLWERSHLDFMLERWGMATSAVTDEVGKLRKRKQLLSGFP